MYNGIGLQTARGSGTNGYVQTNKFFVRPKTGKVTDNTRGFEAGQGTAGITKQPNKDILDQDRKRQLELKLAVLEDKLVDQGYTDAEVAEKIQEARNTLEAAAASEEAGGPTAMVASDNKFSNTQTHQIAARKEKQMETLRSALGISIISEVNEHEVEGNEDDEGKPKDMQMSDSDDDERPEHSFLDRDFKPKKRMVEDLTTEKEDKKKGVRESRNTKSEGERESLDLPRHQRKEAQREREQGDDSSDTHSSGKHAKRGQKKRRANDSDVSRKKHKKHRAYDSDDSDTESSDDDAVRSSKKEVKKYKKGVEEYKKSHKRHDSDGDSDDDLGRNSSKKEVEKHRESHRSHDSDDGKRISKRDTEKYKKGHKRHDTDDESGSEEDLSKKHETQKGKQYMRTSIQYKSEVESDDSGMEKKRRQLEKPRDIPNMNDRWNGNKDSESDSDNVRKRENKVESSHGRRSGVRDDGRDTARDEKIVKHGSRGRDTDEDSDSNYGSKSRKMRVGTNNAVHRKSDTKTDDISDSISNDSDKSSSESEYRRVRAGRSKLTGKHKNEREDKAYNRGNQNGHGSIVEEKGYKSGEVGRDSDQIREISGTADNALDSFKKLENLYTSKKDAVDGSSQEVIRGKGKFDDENVHKQHDSKSRDRNFEQEVENRGGSRRRDDDFQQRNAKHDEPRRGGRREYEPQSESKREDKPRRESRIEEEPQRQNRRDYDYREHGGGRNDNRVEEEHRGRKHVRDEENNLKQKRQTRDDEQQQHGSRKLQGEEERGNRGYEKDRQIDRSKRARYEDPHRLSERKRYGNDRQDDDRAKH